MSSLEAMLPVLLGAAVAVLLYLHSVVFKPVWADDLKTDWKTINNISVFPTLLMIWVTFFIFRDLDFWLVTGATVSIAALTYCFTQSAFTDPQVRSVDRRVLYLAMVPPLGVHGYLLTRVEGNPELILWIVLIMASAALVFLPLMGPSDGRALLLASIAAFPILGINWFTYALFGFVAGLLLYNLILAIYRRKTLGVPILKSFAMKTSFPAVPFILFPFVVAIPLLGLQ